MPLRSAICLRQHRRVVCLRLASSPAAADRDARLPPGLRAVEQSRAGWLSPFLDHRASGSVPLTVTPASHRPPGLCAGTLVKDGAVNKEFDYKSVSDPDSATFDTAELLNDLDDLHHVYLAGWAKTIKQDKKLIISSAGAAQRAADWILGQRGTSGE